MKTLKVIGVVLLAIGAWAAPRPAAAAQYDGSAPLLCSSMVILECGADGACARTTHAVANVPPFVKVHPQGKVVSTMDGKRTSPIKHVERLNGNMYLHGGEGARAWTVIISEATGKMSAAVAGEEHGFLVFGICTLP
jgi:hypothetical protein